METEFDIDTLPIETKDFVYGLMRKVDVLNSEVSLLKDKLAVALLRRFGQQSEKIDPNQPGLFNEAEELVDTEQEEDDETNVEPASNPKKRRRGHRLQLPTSLPRKDKIIDLPEHRKVCPQDGTPLKAIGEEVSERLEIIPPEIYVLRTKRLKYACPCCEEHVAICPAEPSLLPKSNAGPGLLSHILIGKYCDSLPLYRQEGMFKRIGVDLSRSTMARWVIRFGEAVKPLLEMMSEDLRSGPLLHMDETRVQVLKEHDRSPSSQSYMWTMARGSPEGQSIILYHYSASRSSAVAGKLLGCFSGHLVTDGFEAYDKAIADLPIAHCGCMAHARRRFFEAQKVLKGKVKQKSAAYQGLMRIGELYAVERKCSGLPVEEVARIRREEAQPLIASLREWLDDLLPRINPQGLTGQALRYLDRQWDKLVRYADDGIAPIDNNYMERKIRNFAIGRKNWMFADTPKGAQASAAVYSLVETAKANGLDLHGYFKRVIERLPKAETDAQLRALLPFK